MGIFSKCSDVFWKVFGNTKVYKYPFWFVYDPEDPGVDGDHLLRIMKVIKPGDVIMRGWRHYLNGFFIPGEYSHGGVYVGNGEVVHAVAKGVVRCNLLDFAMADRVCIVRPASHSLAGAAQAELFASQKIPYDYQMTEGQEAMYCFELCAECYRNTLHIEKQHPQILNGLISRKEPAWLSASFLNSPDFKKVFEYNPDKKVDFYEN